MIIGAPLKRKEDPRLLTGRGRYVADIVLPGMLEAAVVRSPHAHAALERVDGARARSLPGVALVATGADLGGVPSIPIRLGPRPELTPFLQPPLARDRVRYVGEPVALVVAASRYIAEDAADLVEVRCLPLPPLCTAERAAGPGAVPLHDAAPDNVAARPEVASGDPDAALATSEIRLRRRLSIQRHTGMPMETRGLVAAYDAATGALTVWGPTKVPHFNRQVLADLLGLPVHRLHFIEPEVGGGFGIRGEFYPEDLLIPWAALRLGRPVRWIEDRREHLLAANHSRQQEHDVEVGATRDGRILALVDRVAVDMGAYLRTHGLTVPELTAAMLPGPYRIPHYRCRVECVMTNKTPTGTYRAPGRYEATFVRERMLDDLAAALGADPVEIRRRNLLTPEDMPYRAGTTTLGHPTVYDTGAYASALDAALRDAGYTRLRAWQAEQRARGRHIGIGIACVLEKAGLGPWEMARAEIDASGEVVVYSGLASVGQGMETALAQICAEELRLSIDDVTVVHGDTDRVPYGIGAFASRGTVVGGNAVLLAARAVREQVLDAAARLLEAAPADLVLDARRVSVRGAPARAVTFRELAAAAAPGRALPLGLEPGLGATRFFQPPDMTYPYGTHVAVVEVDPETGAVAVLRYAIAYDVGRAINPMLVRGQLAGGAAQGIGGALLEELTYDAAGQLLSTTFMDYLIPSAMEAPDALSIRILEETPTPLNPLGIKGVGEGGTAGAGAAIANAVADALRPLGVEVTALPLSPDRIRASVSRARQPSARPAPGLGPIPMTGSGSAGTRSRSTLSPRVA
jgi:carbon-monoxide dehydrogenase large subunit